MSAQSVVREHTSAGAVPELGVERAQQTRNSRPRTRSTSATKMLASTTRRMQTGENFFGEWLAGIEEEC